MLVPSFLRRGVRPFIALLTLASASYLVPAHAVPAELSDVGMGPRSVQQKEVPLPVTGGDNPGAQMGQAFKNAEQEGVAMTQNGLGNAVQNNLQPAPGVLGMDVSGWQPNVNWANEYAKGARFAYVKASEGSYFTSNKFSSQYLGADRVGMLRGAYHFAIPSLTGGAEQARFFVANGGGWSPDGRTLPGLLDIEYNPYPQLGDMCFNMSPAQMNAWITDFTETYRNLTGRYPAIYTTTHWWRNCTGNTDAFNFMPLHLASYSHQPGAMPNGWVEQDIWQYSDAGPFAGDSNIFSGTMSDLRGFATNANYRPVGSTRPLVTGKDFIDVPPHHVFYGEVNWLSSNGISRGWEDGTYRPASSITREAMAAFMYRMAGEPNYSPPARSRFSDVPTSHYFYKEISWLADQGITRGWDDGTFRPDESISREAMAAFFYRLAGEPAVAGAAPFVDVDRGAAFHKEISWLASTGITRGWDDGTFRPQEPVSREAMAAFMYRFTYRP